MTETTYVTTVVERTLNAPWGLEGGGFAAPNDAEVRHPDGRVIKVPKATRCEIPPDSVLVMSTGGGGGYGPPSERTAEAVAKDLRGGVHLGGFRPAALPARGLAAGSRGTRPIRAARVPMLFLPAADTGSMKPFSGLPACPRRTGGR